MRIPKLSDPMNDPPLTQRTDLIWRVLDLAASMAAPVLVTVGLHLPAYGMLVLLLSTWSSRFVWAVLRVLDARAKGQPRTLERMVMRGSHLRCTCPYCRTIR
jgi:hypothetical protein